MSQINSSIDDELEADNRTQAQRDIEKTASRELERCVEDLIRFSFSELHERHHELFSTISVRLLSLRKYFPNAELPADHFRLVQEEINERNTKG